MRRQTRVPFAAQGHPDKFLPRPHPSRRGALYFGPIMTWASKPVPVSDQREVQDNRAAAREVLAMGVRHWVSSEGDLELLGAENERKCFACEVGCRAAPVRMTGPQPILVSVQRLVDSLG